MFAYEVHRESDDTMLAEGETVHVITDRDGRARALPDKYRELFLTGAKAF
jgi:acyl-CoA thioester hydrolase